MFTVEGLIPSLLSSLILDMMQHIIMESYDMSNFIGNLIASSPITGWHTSIIHLSITTEGIKSVQYVWAHKTMQPWGKQLPAQYDKCGLFQLWDKAVFIPASDANWGGLSFKCTGTTLNGSKCTHIITSYQPEELIEVKNNWMTLPWPHTVVNATKNAAA